MKKRIFALLCLLCLAFLARAWESCTDLRFAGLEERACLALTLHDGVVEARGNLGTRTLGPLQWDLHALAEDVRVQRTVEGCLSAGLPGADACLRAENLAVRLAEPRGLAGCFFVSGRFFKHVVVTQPLGCVNLTSGGHREEL
jgi:hypothetical protein